MEEAISRMGSVGDRVSGLRLMIVSTFVPEHVKGIPSPFQQYHDCGRYREYTSHIVWVQREHEVTDGNDAKPFVPIADDGNGLAMAAEHFHDDRA